MSKNELIYICINWKRIEIDKTIIILKKIRDNIDLIELNKLSFSSRSGAINFRLKEVTFFHDIFGTDQSLLFFRKLKTSATLPLNPSCSLLFWYWSLASMKKSYWQIILSYYGTLFIHSNQQKFKRRMC